MKINIKKILSLAEYMFFCFMSIKQMHVSSFFSTVLNFGEGGKVVAGVLTR